MRPALDPVEFPIFRAVALVDATVAAATLPASAAELGRGRRQATFASCILEGVSGNL